MGSRGQVALELAKNLKNLKLIVQDFKDTLVGVNSTIPLDLASRITFQEHELFVTQHVTADVYILLPHGLPRLS